MPKGQTLLEVIIAAAIIVVGIVSLITLVIYIQTSSRLTYQEAIALGLAQESIEAARFIRDSNWLEREAGSGTVFSDGLADATTLDYTAIYTWSPNFTDPAQAVTFNFTPDTSSAAETMVYQTLGNLYRQTAGLIPNGFTATPYSRYITLYPICSNDGGLTENFITSDGQSCALTYTGATQIGIQVQAAVSWQNGGSTTTRVLEERLYDWKYAN